MSSGVMKESRSSSSDDGLGERRVDRLRRTMSSPRGSSRLVQEQNGVFDKHRPVKLGNQVEGFERQGQACRFVATELQSDLVVEVDDIKFHLHKFPLLSRSGRLNRLVFESRDTEKDHIGLGGLPGGPEAFELAAKFCYGMAIDLTPSNVAGLRCAAEYLEMTEDLEEGNLITKSEAFLSFVVLGSWNDSLTVLRSCEHLSPWSDNLQLVRRCSESIAWKACTDTRGISWSFLGKDPSSGRKSEGSPDLNDLRVSDASKTVPPDWWFEDALTLEVDHFLKVIAAIKVKGMRADLLGSVVTAYAMKWIPGLSKDNGFSQVETRHMTVSTGQDDFTALQTRTQKLLENIVTILPLPQDAASSSFMLRLLRVANMHNTTAACRAELEKRVGMQLEHASVSDLLVPSFFSACDSNLLYDVDLMQRLLQYFLMQEQVSQTSPSTLQQHLGYDGAFRTAKMKVAKLLDNYLAEAARDPNLPLSKFQALVEALPESSRTSDDGLYRAIDTYLKAHQGLTELERKKLCRSMDCQRLSSEACLHASQNERLPLRVVVQVLFSEQLKIKNALGKDLDAAANFQSTPADSYTQQELKLLKTEMEQMKESFTEFQNDYSLMRQQLQRLLNPKEKSNSSSSSSAWSAGWKKFRRASNTMFHREGIDESPLGPAAPAASSRAFKDVLGTPKARLRRNSLS